MVREQWFVVPAQIARGFEADEGSFVARIFLLLLFHEFFGEKGNADSTHFARAFRTDRGDARLLLERAEYSVVFEGAALDDDMLAEGF